MPTAPTDERQPEHHGGFGDHLHESDTWRRIRPLADFLSRQAGAGVLLVAAAVVALVWANSPWWNGYQSFWANEVSLGFADHSFTLTLREAINDGVMTLFFFVAGLEIKREITHGELHDRHQAALPIAGAVGGMLVPAVIYLAFNLGGDGASGWGIPMATDIAIVMGVIAILSSRVPSWLKLFLLALAIVDDIGAILVIAVFYSEQVSLGWLAFAVGVFAVALVLKPRVPFISAYVALGVICWFALHEAHVHPTLAGVAFGVLAPITPRRNTGLIDAEELLLHPSTDDQVALAADVAARARDSVSVVEWLIHRLSPVTAFVIAPLFALANAGVHVPLDEVGDALSSSVTWGVVAGLVVGKIVGIFGATMLAVRVGVGRMPPGVTPRYLLGASALGGIGFTVSIFVSQLAFGDDLLGRDARLGVLVASGLAALIGAALLVPGTPPTAAPHRDTTHFTGSAAR